MDNIDDSVIDRGDQAGDRRRRLVGAAGVVTVLASLKSASALAEGVCASPSAFSSIRTNPATSHRPIQALEKCHSHGYWKNNDNWPVSKDSTVDSARFVPNTVSALGITGVTKLADILEAGGGYRRDGEKRDGEKSGDYLMGSGEDRAFAADLVSAYLDVKAGAPIPLNDILAMWTVVFGAGYFAPSGGSSWSRSDVRNYLDVLVGKVAL